MARITASGKIIPPYTEQEARTISIKLGLDSRGSLAVSLLQILKRDYGYPACALKSVFDFIGASGNEYDYAVSKYYKDTPGNDSLLNFANDNNPPIYQFNERDSKWVQKAIMDYYKYREGANN